MSSNIERPDIDNAEQWLELYGDVLYRYALLHLRDQHKAEEAVQNTLLAALQARERFQSGSSVRTWLIGILKHKLFDQFRREAREQPLDEEDISNTSDERIVTESFLPDGHWDGRLGDWGHPESAVESGQFWRILQLCLDLLPKRQARLFMLRELLEEKTEKICKELSITPTNLWTMLYRTRLGLRKCLDKNWVG